MDKNAIKKFAVEARRKLISEITYKASLLGITENGIAEPLPQSTADMLFFDIGTASPAKVEGEQVQKRAALVKVINSRLSGSNMKTAFESVVEEVAYTWFNRLIAIRFMEVNGYLPSGVRVLSSEEPTKTEPDIVTAPFETDLDFTPYEMDKIVELKDENRSDDLFRLLFIKQCNKLREILPRLFEETKDYSELLLTLSFTNKDSVVYMLTHDIPEDDFNVEKQGQVEIIGWLYQYYISEKHEEVVDPLHGKTVSKEDVPAATQLFTTDWVVRYLIDNSVGRYWIERNPESGLRKELEFFVTPKDGNIPVVNEKIAPQDVTVLDPCVGSGHFLVYAFDLLMGIYKEYGFIERDAVKMILRHNLFGLDIDGRAAQLAYFAVMMKARQYDRRFFSRKDDAGKPDIPQPNIYAVAESNNIDSDTLTYFAKNDIKLKADIESIVNDLRDATEYGSIIRVSPVDFSALYARFDEIIDDISISREPALTRLLPLVRIADVLSKKYAVVATNPPYLNKFDAKLKTYINNNYADYKGDLFSVFMYRNFGFCKENGYSGFMTPLVWMFIKTYENLRKYILAEKSFVSLIQFEYSAFEEATVPICSFILKNGKETTKGLYFRLVDFKGGMEVQRRKTLEALSDKDCGYFYEATEENFSKIPGSPIAYWVSEILIDSFNNLLLGKYVVTREGMATADNDRFLRNWHEVSISQITFNAITPNDVVKWVPYNKGGDFRKWYGNNDFIVNWENDGIEIKSNIDKKTGRTRSHNYNGEYGFKSGATWSALSSGSISLRFCEEGFLFDSKGAKGFSDSELTIESFIALVNSKVATAYLSFISPTIDFKVGDIILVPVCQRVIYDEKIKTITSNNIIYSKSDWDSFETAWNFKKNPLI